MSTQQEYHRYANGTKQFGTLGSIFNSMHMKPHKKKEPQGRNGEVVVKREADPLKVASYRRLKAQQERDKYKRK